MGEYGTRGSAEVRLHAVGVTRVQADVARCTHPGLNEQIDLEVTMHVFQGLRCN